MREPAASLTSAETAEHGRLHAAWAEPSGLWGFLTSVDPKVIGRRYIFTAFGREIAFDSAWKTRNSSAAGRPAAAAHR